jgi:hypothetical protein
MKLKHINLFESFLNEQSSSNESNTKLTQHKYNVQEIFFNYTKEKIDLDEMISKLKDIEKTVRKDIKEDKNLWFRFFQGDTLATTIDDIYKDLSLPKSHDNHQLMLDNLKKTSELENEIEIHFS